MAHPRGKAIRRVPFARHGALGVLCVDVVTSAAKRFKLVGIPARRRDLENETAPAVRRNRRPALMS
jgi:hypothetical protein